MKVKELIELLMKCQPEREVRLFIDEDIVRGVSPSIKDRGWFTYSLGFCRWGENYVISSIPLKGPEPLDDEFYIKDFSRLAPVKEGER